MQLISTEMAACDINGLRLKANILLTAKFCRDINPRRSDLIGTEQCRNRAQSRGRYKQERIMNNPNNPNQQNPGQQNQGGQGKPGQQQGGGGSQKPGQQQQQPGQGGQQGGQHKPGQQSGQR